MQLQMEMQVEMQVGLPQSFPFWFTAIVSAYGPACANQPEWIRIALTLVGAMQPLLTAAASVFVYGIRFCTRPSMCEST